MDRAQLEQMALDKINKMQTVPASAIDRASLEELALQKLNSRGEAQINPEREASLGFVNRAKYALEPIRSNRKAILVEQFGEDNVMEDDKGEIFVREGRHFLPVNRDGISVADGADMLGALPEMAGGLVGAGLGLVAGVPTGGAASVPLAVGLGAAGAGAGSMIRQGLSAAIGNPQVAELGERAMETGLSAGIGGVASGAATAIKPVAQKAKTGITQWLKGAGGEAGKTVGKTTTKTVAKSNMGLVGEIQPVLAKRTAEEVTGEIADQSGREMVQENMKKLTKIATQEGLPAPSYAQAAQGKAIIAENKVMDMPLIGGKIRKQADTQAKLVRKNLEKITGMAIDADNDQGIVGQVVREYADTNVAARKKIAQELYKAVEDEGAEVFIGKRTFYKKLRDEAAKHGLMNPDGSFAQYDATSGMTRETHKRLQAIFADPMDALRANQSNKVRFDSANALVKTLKANAEELKTTNPDAHRRIIGMIKELNTSLERTLNREAPGLGEKFSAANSNWATYKRQQKALEKLIPPGTSDEHIIRKVMNGSAKIDQMKELIGEDEVKKMARSYVADIFYKLKKSGVARADTAMDAMRKSQTQIKAALGEEAYESAMRNLEYLNSTSRPLNISRASLYDLVFDRGNGFKSMVIKMAGSANTLAESKGTTLTRAMSDKVVETTGRTVGGIADLLGGSSQKAAGAANLLSDSAQRRAGAGVMSPVVAETKEEKRQRVISGRKQGKQ
jgi:hypothetical protein